MDKIYIQISSGRGPRECAYVAARLLDLLQNEARKCSIAYSLMETELSKGPLPEALLSATIELKGRNVHSFASKWLGTVQWVGPSPYRPNHRRKNWFVGVTRVAGPVAAGQLKGRIAVETMRASGPGGQNVNKTSSAVRATHLETGITVTCRESRSQVQNQRMAREKLQEKFDQQQKDLVMARDTEKWSDHQMVERGNPVRVFHGAEFTEK